MPNQPTTLNGKRVDYQWLLNKRREEHMRTEVIERGNVTITLRVGADIKLTPRPNAPRPVPTPLPAPAASPAPDSVPDTDTDRLRHGLSPPER